VRRLLRAELGIGKDTGVVTMIARKSNPASIRAQSAFDGARMEGVATGSADD